ncbi:MAG: papain-like cysteine protease family protein [Bacteroidales bacterium]|nr:papain-like cysteine protease family protein [Bacteroidales bacterium]
MITSILKIKFVLIIFILLNIKTFSQVLSVPLITQSQDQWCWAASSTAILNYYGNPVTECQVAEYNRTVCTWHNFGTTNCCTDPTKGCNYWNYIFSRKGSIMDNLNHFQSISSDSLWNHLTVAQIQTEITNSRPFVIRWGWYSGGGHFIVGHGISDTTIYYMNPWPGEGSKFGLYSWVVNDGSHFWNCTLVLTTSPTSVNNLFVKNEEIKIFPNPSNKEIFFASSQNIKEIRIYGITGNLVYSQKSDINKISIENFPDGIYNLQIFTPDEIINKKIIVSK